MSEYEIRDLVRYLHNVRKKDGSANPIIGEDELGVVAAICLYNKIIIFEKVS